MATDGLAACSATPTPVSAFSTPFCCDPAISPVAAAVGVVSADFPQLFPCASLSFDTGVATLEGVAESSSSMTKAASKTAGSGFTTAASPFASLEAVSSAGFFLGRRAGDCVFVPLEDRERRVEGPAGLGLGLFFCLDCSSAIWRSIAPLSLLTRVSARSAIDWSGDWCQMRGSAPSCVPGTCPSSELSGMRQPKSFELYGG